MLKHIKSIEPINVNTRSTYSSFFSPDFRPERKPLMRDIPAPITLIG